MVSLLAAAAMQSALVIPNPRVLVFSRTLEFRHDNIPSAIEAIKKLGAEHGFQVDATEDSAVFTDQNLEKYDLLCFASTTGDILNEEQHKVLVRFVENGKGWMGIHAASDTEHHWPWYRDLVGAYFKTHPAGGAHVKVQIENRGNPSTANLPNLWIRPDEWYDWDANPRANVQVLASLDESFYRPENPQDHPITWCHWQGKGRSWYTEMGHYKEAYSESIYLSLLYGGLMWAAQGSRTLQGATPYNPQNNGYGSCYFHTEFMTAKGDQPTISFGGSNTLSLGESMDTNWSQLKDSDCGGIAGHAPTSNAFAGTNNWNTVDMLVDASHHRFTEVRINGIVVQRNVDFQGSIDAIKLIASNSKFRNTWVKKLSN